MSNTDKEAPFRRAGIAGFISALGAILLLEHRVRHGRWWDEKTWCHGKLGASLLLAGLVGRGIEKYFRENQRSRRELKLFKDEVER